ncbi:MAG: ATP-binding protein [Oscillospiraceae bacterium]|nr:ATP-binding protein [Oscillospiraceae bacterium]
MKEIEELAVRAESLVLFRRLNENETFGALRALLKTGSAACYVQLCAALYAQGGDLTDTLTEAVLDDENEYLLRAARGESVPKVMRDALQEELSTLQALCTLESAALKAAFSLPAFLPDYETHPQDLAALYHTRLARAPKDGYGVFARHRAFLMRDGALCPVKAPDPVRLEDLPGYEAERQKVIDNTRALLAGLPANNVLLYGDAGTGKSSTIKAVLNEFAPEGLRLVEIKKHQLYQLPSLLDELAMNPLKFILFIDDLSFTQNDDNFAALKAILEGSVSAAGRNTLVYATSNRRHLIKECFSQRDGDDLHESDTREELRSLSARFGLTVTFSRPEKELYLQIVRHLAEKKGLTADAALETRAEAFALRAGARSPRVAKQFIDGINSIPAQ